MVVKPLALSTALYIFSLSILSHTVYANCDSSHLVNTSTAALPISEIIIHSNPIFENDDQAIWIHHLLNKLHLNTKTNVIKSHLTFEVGDSISKENIKESERLLRNKRYLRDATITINNNCGKPQAIVNTWDNWTLLPKISVSRTGGENSYIFGFKDDNFLGRGIKSTLTYFSDEDRTGYGLNLRSPLTHFKHTNLGITAFDNDDGYRYGIKLSRDFYSLNSKYSRFIETEQNTYRQTIQQNGEDINIFKSRKDFADIGFGWSQGKQQGWVSRWIIGLRLDQSDFKPTSNDDNDLYTVIKPENRDFIYPWLEYQRIEDRYQIIKDVHFIGTKEDHHLGWRYSARLGFEVDDDYHEQSTAGHLRASLHKGIRSNKHLLFVSSQATWDFGIQEHDFYKLSTGFEYFYDPGNKTIFYTKTEYTQSENNYLDQPITLGGSLDDGDNTLEFTSAGDAIVRGYPSQYQHGNKRWQITGEVRHYPGIEFYRLVRLAWAGFIDVGRAWGENDAITRNEQTGAISSAGIGIRMASIRSSGRNIIHLDLAKPLTTGEELNGWEIRLQAKHKF